MNSFLTDILRLSIITGYHCCDNVRVCDIYIRAKTYFLKHLSYAFLKGNFMYYK